jgi:hypothetical protein
MTSAGETQPNQPFLCTFTSACCCETPQMGVALYVAGHSRQTSLVHIPLTTSSHGVVLLKEPSLTHKSETGATHCTRIRLSRMLNVLPRKLWTK